MKPRLGHIKSVIMPPNKPPAERPTTLVCDHIDEAWYVKLRPLAALTVVVAGIVAVVYFGAQTSIERSKATVAQANAINQQAQAIDRQTQSIDRQSSIIEGMSEGRKIRAPSNSETKDLMIFIAVVLGVVAAIKCASD